MNFLAHAYFANGDAHRIVGQFCGDFVRGSDLSAYSSGIQRGIRMHRQIDAFERLIPGFVGLGKCLEFQHACPRCESRPA